MKIRMDLRLAQKLIMTPQLQQAIKLLQLSRLELSQMIVQEMLENPLLEDSSLEDSFSESSPRDEGESEQEGNESGREGREKEGGLSWDEYFDQEGEERREIDYSSFEERRSFEQTVAKPTSLADHLLWQLSVSQVSPEEKRIGAFIIGNIDEDGYLRSSCEEIATDAHAPLSHVESVLSLVQGFDPAGVGARSLKECLLIQIDQLGLKGSLVEALIQNHLEALEKKRYDHLVKEVGVSLEEFLAAMKVISRLDPKPGRPFASTEAFPINPDVIVVKSEGEYHVFLNDEGIPRIRVSPFYRQLLHSKGDEATSRYVDEKFRSALWLVRSIEQRNRTILRVAESIVRFQKEFLDNGVSSLKPLVLKQVADDVGMHESTVSRVTTNKYMETPRGIYELKFFFTSGIATQQGDELSSVTVREMIRRMVREENPRNPLKDQEIAERLRVNRIEIARRTIAKYRAALNIPSANQRKKTV